MTGVKARTIFLPSLSLALLVLLLLTTGLAAGFLIPIVLLAAGAGLALYLAVRHQGLRNPLAPDDVTPSERWSDGQPLERAAANRRRVLKLVESRRQEEKETEERIRREQDERREVNARGNPRDFTGPPPVNPFP